MAQSNTPSPLMLGLLAAGGYAAYRYYRAHQAAQANNMRIKIGGVHLENDGTVNMDIQVSNPNSAAFTFKSILGDLTANGQKIAELKMFGDYTVRPNDQATIPVLTRIISQAVFHNLATMFKGKKVALHFSGTVNVNDKAIPLTLNYTV